VDGGVDQAKFKAFRNRARTEGQQATSTAEAAGARRSSLAPIQVDPVKVDAATIRELQNQFQFQMQKLAQDLAKFNHVLKQIYGDKLNPQAADHLLDQARRGQFPLPANVRLMDGGALQGKNAAYSPQDGGTVYLNQSLLADPKGLQEAFNEECGHHLDRLLGDGDSLGDEGRALSQTLSQGRPLSPAQLASCRHARDQGTLEIDGKRAAVEFQDVSNAARDAVAKVGEQIDGRHGVTATGLKEAVNTLRALRGKDFGDVLAALQADGKLQTLLDQAPAQTRKEFLSLVQEMGSPEVQDKVAKEVAKNIGGLMTGIKTDADAARSVALLKDLSPGMLGSTLAALHASKDLSTLLAEMLPETRAGLMKTVTQSGNADAQAILLKAVSDEMNALRDGKFGKLKYLLSTPLTPGGVSLAERYDVHVDAELDARRQELTGLLSENTAEAVKALRRAGDLTEVQKNLIQPPTVENREALFAMFAKLRDQPETAAIFMHGLLRAIGELENIPNLGQAVVQSVSGVLEMAKLDPQPLIDALSNHGKHQMAQFLSNFRDQFLGFREDIWRWSPEQLAAFNQEMAGIAQEHSTRWAKQ
jgi:hypothetical protein